VLGLHWLVEMDGIEHAPLDPPVVASLLEQLVAKLGLTQVGEPLAVAQAPGRTVAMVLLAESHISLHLEGQTAFADLFSCAPFDVAVAGAFLREHLRPKTWHERLIERERTVEPVRLDRPAQVAEIGDDTVLQESAGDDGFARDLALRGTLFDDVSGYQHIQVVDTVAYGRALFLDGVLQLADIDEEVYHRALVAPALSAHEAPKRVLIAGGGDGAAARQALAWPGVEQVTMVEIDPMVVRACKDTLPDLGAWDDPRLQIVYQDVFEVLGTGEPWDVILVDLTDDVTRVSLDPSFRAQLKSSLAPGGVFCAQLGEVDRAAPEDARDAIRAARDVFPESVAYHVFLESFGASWGFVVSKDPGAVQGVSAALWRRWTRWPEVFGVG